MYLALQKEQNRKEQLFAISKVYLKKKSVKLVFCRRQKFSKGD